MPGPCGPRGRRPAFLRDPAPRDLPEDGRGPVAVVHPGPDHGLAVDARVLVLQPPVPPPEALLQKAGIGRRQGLVGVLVAPRADPRPPRHAQARHQPEGGVRVGVRPSSNRKDRAGDGGEVLAHRAMLPEGVAALVAEPFENPGRAVLEAPEPRLAPIRPDQRRIRRPRVVAEHREAPVRILEELAAAHGVDVGCVSVVRRADRNDRAESGRTTGGDLEAIESAPALAEHAHPSGAPCLLGEPGDDLDRVGLLLLEVFAEEEAVGLSAAPKIDAERGVAVPGEVGVHCLVARRGPVPLAVGDVLEEGGNRVGFRVGRQPAPVGEPGSVGKRNPAMLDLADGSRQCLAAHHPRLVFGSTLRGDHRYLPGLIAWRESSKSGQACKMVS